MKHIVDGVLRLIVAGYSIETLIFSGYRPNLLTDSPAESIGSVIGIIIGFYILVSFWLHYIVQGIRLLKNKKTKKIRFISVPCIIAGIMFIYTYISSLIKIINANSFNIFTLLYPIITGVLVYITIQDVIIVRQAKTNEIKSESVNEDN